MESPELGGTAVVNDLLVIAVGALTGGASPIEVPPGLRASLNGPDQAWMGVEGHAVTRAPGRVGVGAPLLFIKGTRPAADILPTLGVVVVAVGSTQAATGGIGRAMLIITALQESFWGEVFTARIIGDEGDATLAPYALIVCRDVVGRIAQLHLPRHDEDGDFVPMRLEVRPFIRIGRLSRVAQGQCESEFGVDIGRLLLQLRTAPLLLGGVLGVKRIANTRIEVFGDLRAVAPQLALGVSS